MTSTTTRASASKDNNKENVDGKTNTIPTKNCTEDDIVYKNSTTSDNKKPDSDFSLNIVSRNTIKKEISKQVIRQKLQKLRHLVVKEGISPTYLDSLFPQLLELFDPQTVQYNGGIAKITKWKISCYLEVMKGGIPCTNPNLQLLEIFQPLLDTCNDLFLYWYKQQHTCNTDGTIRGIQNSCSRLMTFITRYTPAPGEQALLKHVDGAGKVDGSCVVALPIDCWSDSYDENTFEGYGGGLTFWDGKERNIVETDEVATPPKQQGSHYRPKEIHYDTRSGDIAFIDRAVWHQADPITKGTRWALVIFYKVH